MIDSGNLGDTSVAWPEVFTIIIEIAHPDKKNNAGKRVKISLFM